MVPHPFFSLIYATITTETRLSAQNDISREEVFNVRSSHISRFTGWIPLKIVGYFFHMTENEERLRFFVIFSVVLSVDYTS